MDQHCTGRQLQKLKVIDGTAGRARRGNDSKTTHSGRRHIACHIVLRFHDEFWLVPGEDGADRARHRWWNCIFYRLLLMESDGDCDNTSEAAGDGACVTSPATTPGGAPHDMECGRAGFVGRERVVEESLPIISSVHGSKAQAWFHAASGVPGSAWIQPLFRTGSASRRFREWTLQKSISP